VTGQVDVLWLYERYPREAVAWAIQVPLERNDEECDRCWELIHGEVAAGRRFSELYERSWQRFLVLCKLRKAQEAERRSRARARIHYVDVKASYGRMQPSVIAECTETGFKTEHSWGQGPKSIKRCQCLLRDGCPCGAGWHKLEDEE
jgi:hypothetical protein